MFVNSHYLPEMRDLFESLDDVLTSAKSTNQCQFSGAASRQNFECNLAPLGAEVSRHLALWSLSSVARHALQRGVELAGEFCLLV